MHELSINDKDSVALLVCRDKLTGEVEPIQVSVRARRNEAEQLFVKKGNKIKYAYTIHCLTRRGIKQIQIPLLSLSIFYRENKRQNPFCHLCLYFDSAVAKKTWHESSVDKVCNQQSITPLLQCPHVTWTCPYRL